MKKMNFISPELEIVTVSKIDVMTTSVGEVKYLNTDIQWLSEPKIDLGV